MDNPMCLLPPSEDMEEDEAQEKSKATQEQ
jgi:hypothetical protein